MYGAEAVAEALMEAFEETNGVGYPNEVQQMRSFEEAGTMTQDAGFEMTYDDGSVYQVTVVRTR